MGGQFYMLQFMLTLDVTFLLNFSKHVPYNDFSIIYYVLNYNCVHSEYKSIGVLHKSRM